MNDYDKVSNQYDDFYHKNLFLAENEIIFKDLCSSYLSGHILDIGCGTGFLLDNVKISPEWYLGIDISEGMLKRAREKHPKHYFKIMDMDLLESFKGGSFDSIVMLWSFAYSANPEKLINDIYRILKPKGTFYVITYATKFKSKHSYILNGIDHKFYLSMRTAKDMFSRYSQWRTNIFITKLQDTSITGFRYFDISLIYNLNPKIIKAFLRFDKKFQDRCPDNCYYLIIKGRKR